MKINKFLAYFFVLVLIIPTILYWQKYISLNFFFPFVIAYLLNLVNTTVAIKLFDRSIHGTNKLFLVNVLGGMGIRIIFLLISILLIIKLLNIDKYLFIFTFFIIYFFLLVAEIFYYNTKLKLKKINVDNGNKSSSRYAE